MPILCAECLIGVFLCIVTERVLRASAHFVSWKSLEHYAAPRSSIIHRFCFE